MNFNLLLASKFSTPIETLGLHTFRFRASASILWFKCSKLVFGGMIPFSRTKMVLMSPAILLAPSRWPMLDFTAPLYRT